jgi:HD-GYP domain-containing protein (c-di-GMP phosphodiesterase class II)
MTTLEELVANTNFNHSRHVAQISKIIAIKAGYSNDETTIIEQSGLLHDVGKIDLPFGILNKPGGLTVDEYNLVKKHTENGYRRIMEIIRLLTIAADVAREHHERLDGSGYLHLTGGNISRYAKLISVADVFDALISRRSYKEPWDVQSILQYLTNHENHFDHTIVGYLISAINEVLSTYKAIPAYA